MLIKLHHQLFVDPYRVVALVSEEKGSSIEVVFDDPRGTKISFAEKPEQVSETIAKWAHEITVARKGR